MQISLFKSISTASARITLLCLGLVIGGMSFPNQRYEWSGSAQAQEQRMSIFPSQGRWFRWLWPIGQRRRFTTGRRRVVSQKRQNGIEALESRIVLSVGDSYIVPAGSSVTINEDPSWKFALNPSGTPQSVAYNDSSWSNVDLPYTWDGAATTSPPTGPGWFRKTINVTNDLIGDELYLQFEGGYLVTNLYIDGTQVDYNPNVAGIDSHNGGWSGFNFDVTSQLTAGSHLIAVSVNNSSVANISPGNSGNTGDYSHEGGLYRDVSLIAVSKTHVALLENATDVPPNTSPASIPTNTPIATPGVYFSTTSSVTIGIASANIQVKTVLDNQSASPSSVNVTSYLVDASGTIQSQQIFPTGDYGGSDFGLRHTEFHRRKSASVGWPH